MSRAITLLALNSLIGLLFLGTHALGQTPFSGNPQAMRQAMEAQAKAAQAAGKAPNGQPQKPDEKKDGDKPKEGEEKKDKEGESSDSIKRPEKPPNVPDPREFDAKPDDDGKVEFNFYGQAWPIRLDHPWSTA